MYTLKQIVVLLEALWAHDLFLFHLKSSVFACNVHNKPFVRMVGFRKDLVLGWKKYVCEAILLDISYEWSFFCYHMDMSVL